jgi:hypothetical protein
MLDVVGIHLGSIGRTLSSVHLCIFFGAVAVAAGNVAMLECNRNASVMRMRGWASSTALRAADRVLAMTNLAETQAPRAHARIVYHGPVAPHWEVYGDWGDRQVLDEFRARVLARLVLLPRDDPQFRRNRERIVRDAERELITIEWDLGYAEDMD